MFQARPGSQASQLLSSTLEGDESSAGNKTSKLSQGLNQKKKTDWLTNSVGFFVVALQDLA